jgi:glycosyltransferase involved in cell wall biosynthesis
LFVGRFVPKKGFAHVAAAASDSYGLVFVGGDRPPGTDDQRLHFLGAVAAGEMPRIYRCADVMVVASVGECPLTVLEAMSSGLPVVANEDPALHSPWTSGPGVRFVDMPGGGLRDALEQLVADRTVLERAGADGPTFVGQSFSWDSHVDRLESVYASIRVGSAPPRHLSEM